MLDEISEHPRTFYMSAEGNDKVIDMSKNGCLAPEELSIKIGAMVMFVKNNYQKGYVNGTLGEVINYSDKGYPVVRTLNGTQIEAAPEHWMIEENGQLQADISQVPLRLAWAITVHKSQGMSLDAAELDLRQCFVPGMGYVALSRVRSLQGIRLLGLNQMALQINPDVLAFDFQLQEKSKNAQTELSGIKKRERTKRQKAFLKTSDALL
jgi:ATP-dependent exoDNAse (exonuclease V) alpha subunit